MGIILAWGEGGVFACLSLCFQTRKVFHALLSYRDEDKEYFTFRDYSEEPASSLSFQLIIA